MSTALSVYAAVALSTAGFALVFSRPRGLGEWLGFVAISVFWPAFLLWVVSVSDDG